MESKLNQESENPNYENNQLTSNGEPPELQPKDLNRRISNRRERVENFLKLTGIYGELVEECFNFLTQEPIDPFANYEKAKEENPELTIEEYSNNLIDMYEARIKEIIQNKLGQNNFSPEEINRDYYYYGVYKEMQLRSRVRNSNFVNLIINQLGCILFDNIRSILEKESKEILISKIKEVINLNTNEEIQPEITIYLTHIEVYLPITEENFCSKFNASGFVKTSMGMPPIMVIPQNNNNTSTKSPSVTETTKEIENHEIQHIKQEQTKLIVNFLTDAINESPYTPIINELTAFLYEKFAERNNNLIEELEKLSKYFVEVENGNYFDYYLKHYHYELFEYQEEDQLENQKEDRQQTQKKVTKTQVIKIKQEIEKFFNNLIFLIKLLEGTPNYDEYISYIKNYLNNLDGLLVNPQTFYLFPLRILQSIDPIVGRAEIKYRRNQDRTPSIVNPIMLKVESLKKDLEKESQKEYPLLPKYLNLIKLEIEDLMKELSTDPTDPTDHEIANLLKEEEKEKLIQALRDIQEIENSLSKTKN